MLTWARPPGIQPKTTFANAIRRSVMRPSLISSPARMNSGIAMSTNTSIPWKIRSGNTGRKAIWPLATSHRIDDAAIVHATGSPANRRTRNDAMKIPSERLTRDPSTAGRTMNAPTGRR